ncbi:MAG TPA: hypothetical protein DIU15_16400 [Deltaproteobacteria bacterium]|nr:hypothetical protein [Deltaproteobacteria bacterium]HCP47624.1 hypothetical protein [Deltaproteobacteria bacterium]
MTRQSQFSRRGVLQALAAATGTGTLGWSGDLLALGDRKVGVARLDLPDLPDPRPGALTDLLREVSHNSSISAEVRPALVDPGSEALFEHPFVVLSGDRGFEPLGDQALANLRLYVREGGLLFVDDATGLERSAFDDSVRRELSRLLPGTPLRRIGRDHAIYRSFFLMRGVAGRMVVQPYLEGLWLGDITPVLYSRNDLLGAVWRSSSGGYALEVVPGGERQRLQARRMAINLVLFAVTGNYKRDVVHVKTLLKRMRRQGGYGE